MSTCIDNETSIAVMSVNWPKSSMFQRTLVDILTCLLYRDSQFLSKLELLSLPVGLGHNLRRKMALWWEPSGQVIHVWPMHFNHGGQLGSIIPAAGIGL